MKKERDSWKGMNINPQKRKGKEVIEVMEKEGEGKGSEKEES